MKQELLNYVMFAVLGVDCAWRYWSGHITGAEVLVSLGAFGTLGFPLQSFF